MGLKEQKEKELERAIRLKSKNNEVFKEAYLELKASYEYAKSHFKNTAIYPCLKKELLRYAPKFKQLTSQSSQSNTCQ